jgi:hypothetical protein
MTKITDRIKHTIMIILKPVHDNFNILKLKYRHISFNKDMENKRSFFPCTISNWDKLPETLALSSDLESFQKYIYIQYIY